MHKTNTGLFKSRITSGRMSETIKMSANFLGITGEPPYSIKLGL